MNVGAVRCRITANSLSKDNDFIRQYSYNFAKYAGARNSICSSISRSVRSSSLSASLNSLRSSSDLGILQDIEGDKSERVSLNFSLACNGGRRRMPH